MVLVGGFMYFGMIVPAYGMKTPFCFLRWSFRRPLVSLTIHLPNRICILRPYNY